jgi:hypothetical protein
MQSLANAFIAELGQSFSIDQRALLWALSDRWNAVFRVTYPIEFLCLSVAKLLVLDRMSDFAAGTWISKRWFAIRRIVIVIVVAVNLAGLVGNIVAAVCFDRVADIQVSRSADLAANNTDAAAKTFVVASEQYQIAVFISSVQSFCEAAVLLLIVVAFTVVGFACARRVGAALSKLDSSGYETTIDKQMQQHVVDKAMALGKQIQRNVVVSTAVVFVTFIIRSTYSTWYAVAFKLQDFSNISQKCLGISVCDALCFNTFTHIYFWMLRTPEFQLMVVLLSKPLPLLVVLHGMTTGRMRRMPCMRAMKGSLLNTLTIWRRSGSQQVELESHDGGA